MDLNMNKHQSQLNFNLGKTSVSIEFKLRYFDNENFPIYVIQFIISLIKINFLSGLVKKWQQIPERNAQIIHFRGYVGFANIAIGRMAGNYCFAYLIKTHSLTSGMHLLLR